VWYAPLRRIDDNELRVLICEMHIDFPDVGEVMEGFAMLFRIHCQSRSSM